MVGMNKIEAKTPKGFRDFLGVSAKVRQEVITTFSKVFERFGFEPLITPALEYAEVLKGKYGEEEKLIYEFEDRGGRQVALRYDQTVPLARVVANYPDITKPYKRYQIQPVWRAENPQKGRFREFIQVDIDTIGSSSLLVEAETISCIVSAMQSLGFKNFNLKVNDREIFAGLPNSVISTIDKLDKIGKEGVIALLKNQSYSDFQAADILKKVTDSKPTPTIEKLFNLLTKYKISQDFYSFDPSLARGLDYYTGLIFELEIEGYSTGSIGGGGRYDRLIGTFTDKEQPAMGFSFGFDRIIEAMESLELLPKKLSTTEILVTVFNNDLLDESLEVVSGLRDQGINTEISLDPEAKLDKQIKYADQKNIPFVIVLGPEEAKNKTLTLKNLQTTKQSVVKLSQIKTLIDQEK